MIPSSSPPSPEQPGRLTAIQIINALREMTIYSGHTVEEITLLRAAALQIETLEKEREELIDTLCRWSRAGRTDDQETGIDDMGKRILSMVIREIQK